jgi:hypothetical protein
MAYNIREAFQNDTKKNQHKFLAMSRSIYHAKRYKKVEGSQIIGNDIRKHGQLLG